jgi:hypothetical protein
MKLEQYKRGEKFVAGVAAAGGRESVKLIWAGARESAEREEFADPQRWRAPRVYAAVLCHERMSVEASIQSRITGPGSGQRRSRRDRALAHPVGALSRA